MKKNKILPFEYEITDQPITGMGGLPVFLAALFRFEGGFEACSGREDAVGDHE